MTLGDQIGRAALTAARGMGDLATRAMATVRPGPRRVRVAVTGLSRAGKTTFLTALVHHLLAATEGGAATAAAMPDFRAAAEGRLTRYAFRATGVGAEFPFRPNRDRLLAASPGWPDPTSDIRGLSLTLHYRATGGLAALLGERELLLDMIDYPGEWLLDLPLLDLDFAAWSRATVALCAHEPRRGLAAAWREELSRHVPGAAASEAAIDALHAAYAGFLRRCRDEARLSLLQPGLFLNPGNNFGLEPEHRFCPLDLAADARPEPGSLHDTMARRFEAYKRNWVEPFFRERFASFDRQVVLVDVLGMLAAGPAAFEDSRAALAATLESFGDGRGGWIARLIGRRPARLLFAATKADHVARSQYGNLHALLKAMARDASAEDPRAEAFGAGILASVRSTMERRRAYDGQARTVLHGRRRGGEEGDWLPPEVPGELPGPEFWDAGPFELADFAPPSLAPGAPLPHIKLDTVLEFLLGDVLA